MKISFFFLVLFIVSYGFAEAQIINTDPNKQHKMGFMDFAFTLGTMKKLTHEDYSQNTYSDTKSVAQFINLHASESMLSNWWNADDKTKLYVGFRENLDVGLGHFKNSQTIFDPTGNAIPFADNNKIGLIFSYEGGLSAMYRINNMMDVGFTYFFISLSTFNKNGDINNYPMFRFRYANLMAEVAVKARTQIDLKYILNSDNIDDNFYIGLSYINTKRTLSTITSNNVSTNFFQIMAGLQF